jgi:hypothetical protein
VPLLEQPHRVLDIGFARQRREYLRKNRNADSRDERVGPRRDPIDIAGDNDTARARERRGADSGLLIDVVHMQDASGDEQRRIESLAISLSSSSRLQTTLRSPDRSWTRMTELIVGVTLNRVTQIDAASMHRLPDAAPVLVASDRAEKARAESQRRARGERRRGLSAARDRVATHADFRIGTLSAGIRGHPVHVVDRRRADADHIPERHGASFLERLSPAFPPIEQEAGGERQEAGGDHGHRPPGPIEPLAMIGDQVRAPPAFRTPA